MKFPFYSFALSFLLLAFGCNPNRVYESHQDPPGNLEWIRSDVLSFDIEIIDASIKYDQIITFRHAAGYAFSACSLKIVEKTPSGEKFEHFLTLSTADQDGYLGDCSGDICDLEEIWRDSYTFTESGTYHYDISHEMSDDKIHMVMEVGMALDLKDQSTQ